MTNAEFLNIDQLKRDFWTMDLQAVLQSATQDESETEHLRINH